MTIEETYRQERSRYEEAWKRYKAANIRFIEHATPASAGELNAAEIAYEASWEALQALEKEFLAAGTLAAKDLPPKELL